MMLTKGNSRYPKCFMFVEYLYINMFKFKHKTIGSLDTFLPNLKDRLPQSQMH